MMDGNDGGPPMTTEPLPVRPVEFEYYQDKDVAVLRVMRFVAIVGIIYGMLNVLAAALQFAGVVMGTVWYRNAGAWYLLVGLTTGVLSIVLVLSGIGCLSLKPAARAGMLVYAVAAITVQCVATGAQVVPLLRSSGRAAMGISSALDTTMILTGYVVWQAQGFVLPVLLLMVFRLREVRRAFEK